LKSLKTKVLAEPQNQTPTFNHNINYLITNDLHGSQKKHWPRNEKGKSMTPVAANPLFGTVLHAFGAICAALCYTPQHKLQGWSWQTYWITQAAFCWFILPIIGALITIPDIFNVLRMAPKEAMLSTFVLGVAYGIGGTAFGVAIKKIGYSLTYAIAIGISCIFGTLTGPIIKGELAAILEKDGSGWIMFGVFIGLVGTIMCGLAGRLKELELQKDYEEKQPFKLVEGLVLCGIAGVLSAVYGIAVNDTGAPIAKVAAEFRAGHWQTNVVYIFSNSGAFLSTAVYCLWLAKKEKTFSDFRMSKNNSTRALGINYFVSFLTGMMWYSQFLFYGIAHVRMGQFKFSSWAIHMIMLILFSSSAGIVMKEWHGRSQKTKFAIAVALTVVAAAVLMITHGNYIGQRIAEH
jgi:L-rhamnose-H+ transport protein